MKQWLFLAVLFSIVGGVFLPSFAEEPTASMTQDAAGEFVITKTDNPPVMDGVVTSEEWNQAKRITGFCSNTDGKLIDAPQPEVFFTFDEKNLYIGFICTFDKVLKADAVGHTLNAARDDAVEIFLDPLKTEKSWYQFLVNSRGAYFEIRNGDKNWWCEWQYKCRLAGKAWMGEISIPFSALESIPYHDALWGFNVCRDYQNPTQYTSVAGMKGDFAQPAKFLRMIFKGGPQKIPLSSRSFQLDCRISGIDTKFLVPKADMRAIPPGQRKNLNVFLKVTDAKSRIVFEGQMKDWKDSKASTNISIDNFQPGTYSIEVSLVTKKGRLVGSRKDEFIKPDVSKWIHNKIGIDHSVPIPWTPIRVNGNTICCWNRQYTFSGTPFPSEIQIGDKSILAGEIRLGVVVDGKDTPQDKVSQILKEQFDDQVTFAITRQNDSLALESTATTEFDGMIRVDLNILPQKPVQVEKLYLEIPLKSEYATLQDILKHPWDFFDPNIMGKVSDRWIGKITPYIWLGNEELGLAWFTETFRNWHLKNENKAVEIVRRNGRVVLRIHLIDVPFRLEKPIEYTFGLQATPVKPLRTDWLAAHISSWWESKPNIYIEWAHTWVVKWFAFPEPLEPETVLSKYKSYALGGDGSYNARISSIRAKGPKGMKYLQYINLNYCSGGVPEYRYFVDEWFSGRVAHQSGDVRAFGHSLNSVCAKTTWSDFIAYRLKQFIDEYNTDGLYYDNAWIWPCRNTHCGCGYMKNDKEEASYPIFAFRELQKRIYKYAKGKKPDYLFFAHPTGAMYMPFLSFFDMYIEGERFMASEALKIVNGNYMDLIPLDKFQTEFIGKNLGVTPVFLAELRNFTTDPKCTETMMALCRIHGTNIWEGPPVNHTPTIMKLWEEEDKFGLVGAEFLPYWNNRQFVSPSSADIRISVIRKKNKILLYIVNFNNSDIQEAITLNLERLGISTIGQPTVTDVYAGQSVSLENRLLKLTVPAKRFRMIVIAPGQ